VSKLRLVTSLLVVVALLVGGCSAEPESIESLTDGERDWLKWCRLIRLRVSPYLDRLNSVV